MVKIRIENVVASTSLGDELDLQSIALGLDGAEYEPEQFPGLIYRLKQPKTAITAGPYLFMDATLVDQSNVKQFLN